MRYRAPSRFRRVLKWAGLVVCAVLVVAWAATEPRSVIRAGASVTLCEDGPGALLRWRQG